MKKIILLLLPLFLLTTLSFAQSNFKPAYVVTLAGDTVKGEVDYQEWGSNPSGIRFRTADNKTHNFTTADIKYFNIDKLDIYQRYSGPISHDETNSNRVIGGRDTSFTVKDVFLKVLQTGKVVNLYAYSDAIKPRYFYSDPNAGDAIHELVYRIYTNGGSTEIQKSNTTVEATYLQQLTAIALKANLLDDQLQGLLEGAEYTQSALLKITTALNGYTKAQLAINQPGGNNDKFDLYAGLGLNATTIKSYDEFDKPIGSPYTSVLPRAVFGLITYLNPNTRRLQFSAEFSATDIMYKNSYGNTNYSVNQLGITLAPAIAYNIYNGSNFKFYAGLGIGLSKYTYLSKKFFRNDGTAIPMNFFPFVFSNFNNVIIYKVGFLLHKNIQIYGEHLSGDPLSRFSLYRFSQSSNNFGINYILGKQK
nr:hypothetical protein [uncultured Mucilaginibacter sp.]